MRTNQFNRFLRAEASDLGEGGGGAAGGAQTPAAATPAASPAAPGAGVPPPAAELTLLQKVSAAVQSKGAILAESAELREQVTSLKGQLAGANTELTGLRAENAALKAERTGIEQALTTAQANNRTVDEAAAAQLASQGFSAASLPAAETEPETVASLTAKMDASKDNKEIYQLAKRINELESAA